MRHRADPGIEPGRAGSHPPASATRATRGSQLGWMFSLPLPIVPIFSLVLLLRAEALAQR